jgi:radical SAM protein with 4Fe4S-binding SPASM domain
MKNRLAGYRLLWKSVTAARLWNAAKVLSGYTVSRLVRSPVAWGMPMALSVEPTTSCNLRCPECPSGLRSFSRPTGMLQEDRFRSLLDQAGRHAAWLTFYFQGEPFLHPGLVSMIREAVERKIFTVTSTNAHYLDDTAAEATVRSGLHQLILSVDGITQETYAKYRVGGQLEKVLQGARNVVRWKRALQSPTPHIIFQFLVVRHNEHEVEALLQLAETTGADEVRLKTAQVYDFAHGSALIPHNEQYTRYRKQPDGSYRIRNKLLNHCWKMWHSAVMTWDGRVVPCCFDKDAQHVMGILPDQSLKEIWHGAAYRRFRSALLKGRKEIDICQNCSEGTSVWA